MILEACICEDGFGVPHDHLPAWFAEHDPVTGLRRIRSSATEIRIWVDWRRVAQAFCTL